eukprot:11338641-Alexandrium_andersonii.AAC.1
MPAHLPHAEPLQSGAAVPGEWLAVDQRGTAGRFNAGVCLLEPSLALLEYIVEQVEPFRPQADQRAVAEEELPALVALVGLPVCFRLDPLELEV